MVVKTIPRWVSCTSKLIDWTVPLLHCGGGARTLVLHEQVAPAGEQLPGQAAQAVRDALAHAPLHGAGVPRHKALPVRRPRAWRARARAHLPAAPPSSSCQAECSRERRMIVAHASAAPGPGRRAQHGAPPCRARHPGRLAPRRARAPAGAPSMARHFFRRCASFV